MSKADVLNVADKDIWHMNVLSRRSNHIDPVAKRFAYIVAINHKGHQQIMGLLQ